MIIYAVVNNFMSYDSDMWQSWENKNILSYHKTNESALAKIATLSENIVAFQNKDGDDVLTYTIEAITIQD